MSDSAPAELLFFEGPVLVVGFFSPPIVIGIVLAVEQRFGPKAGPRPPLGFANVSRHHVDRLFSSLRL